LHGETIIPFSIGSVISSNTSSGHRQLDPVPVTITSADSYVATLKKHFVLVDETERLARIENALDEYTSANACTILEKERVIQEVVNLVEWPEVTPGAFDESFLSMPQEVLISEMVEHQRYFPVADASGALLNKFLLTADRTPTPLIGN